ncbi:C39 family peptidase [Thermococcus sp. AM4]|uniref:C39 family peptidase n=1 Tax=Thermococcus sp. (strain AM4) TaxID=246969 RepID=UPI0002299389|nr:C39 family peptidase [Thermococcus sp. AM4]EEB72906.2 conserved hypothetical protein [Thermococcus sp. AM4]
MKKKFLVVLFLGVLLLGGVVISTPVKAGGNNRKDILPVVRKLAIRELHKFPEFSGAIPTNPVPLYFPDGELAAYEFKVVRRGQTIGYIIVSANKKLPPTILEAGMGPETPSEIMKKLAKKKGLHNYKVVYFAGLEYGLLSKDKVIDSRGMEHRKPNYYQFIAGASPDSINKWATIESTSYSSSYTSTSTITSEKILYDVPAWTSTDEGGASEPLPPGANSINPNLMSVYSSTSNPYDYIGPNPDPWKEYDGCAPIAASMVVAYYDTQYRNDWYREAIIDILHETMKTDYEGWTDPSNIGPGIEDFYDRAMYLYHEGVIGIAPTYSYTTSTITDPDNSLIFTYVWLEISTDTPLLLTASAANGSDFKWAGVLHTVTVTGYRTYSDGEKYLLIHTTYGSPYPLKAWILLDSIGEVRSLTLINPVKMG